MISKTYGPIKFVCEDKAQWVVVKMLTQRAETHADEPFLQYEEDKPVSFKEANEAVNRIAQGLAKLGISKGDMVMIMLPNCLEFIYSWLAVNKLGAVEVPVNTAYKGRFLEHVANTSQAKVMIADQGFLDRVKSSEEQLEYLEKVIVYNERGIEQNGIPNFKTLEVVPFDSLKNSPPEEPEVEVNYYGTMAIMYTSGTTGPSKGVVVPYAAAHGGAETYIHSVQWTGKDIVCTCLPLFHASGMVMIYGCLITGAKLVLYRYFSASDWPNQMYKSKATLTFLMGAMTGFVLAQSASVNDRRHNLRAVWMIPCSHYLMDKLKHRFGLDRVVGAYGLTEAWLVTIMPPGEHRPGSSGKAVDSLYDVRIADPQTEEELPVGQVGEVLVRPRTPWTMSIGYYKMPEETAHAYRGCWFHTGDAFTVDEDGFYYFRDRLRDVLRRRGENVPSPEIEAVMNDHDAVLESALIGIKEEYGDEDELKACVVLKEGAILPPGELIVWCDERLPYFAVPRYVEFMDNLPKTPTGRVQKYVLRERGVTPDTWDRVKAGVKLGEEIKKLERKKERYKGK